MISIGSTNKAKIEAVQELLPHLKVTSCSVPSGVSEQPMTLQETIQGAKNRAQNAFQACDNCTYGFGIESGLMEAPGTATGFLHVSACAIFNGNKYCVGLSTGFEVPPSILSLITDQKLDLTDACLRSGISTNALLGSTEGLIGILTKGKVDRKEYSKQAILSALVQLDHAKWY